MNTRILVSFILTCMVAAVAGCNNRVPAPQPTPALSEGRIAYELQHQRQREESLKGPGRVILTFRNYRIGDDPNLAIVVLGDHWLGTGRPGFERLLAEIRKLPPGTCVVDAFASEGPEDNLRPAVLPYRSYGNALERTIVESGLSFEFPVVFGGRHIIPATAPTTVKSPPHLLTFPNLRQGVRTADIIYVLDGKEIGTGEEGYRHLVERMKKMERGSTVIDISRHAGYSPAEIALAQPGIPYADWMSDLFHVVDESGVDFIHATRLGWHIATPFDGWTLSQEERRTMVDPYYRPPTSAEQKQGDGGK